MTQPRKTKNELIRIAHEEPLRFEAEGYFSDLIHENTKLTFKDLREMTKEVYSMNESSLLEESDASKGNLGDLNRKETEKRIQKFNDKIDNKFRDVTKPERKLILAEGDSWFNFPRFVDDIIDHLMEEDNFAIYPIAYGGDWITNIIYEEKYVEELSLLRPDVFLVSGAGNDMVGANKAAVMVNPTKNPDSKYKTRQDVISYWDNDIPKSWINHSKDKDDVYEGQQYLTKHFYTFVIIMKANYYLIFNSISKSSQFEKMVIITQGYDYAIPSLKNHFSWRYPFQFFINKFMDTGKWLSRPMALKGILDDKQQRRIVKAMIFILNEMFITLANDFNKSINQSMIKHLDCRNIARQQNDWFDELHLKSHKFKEVATAYTNIINGKAGDSNIIAGSDYIHPL